MILNRQNFQQVSASKCEHRAFWEVITEGLTQEERAAFLLGCVLTVCYKIRENKELRWDFIPVEFIKQPKAELSRVIWETNRTRTNSSTPLRNYAFSQRKDGPDALVHNIGSYPSTCKWENIGSVKLYYCLSKIKKKLGPQSQSMDALSHGIASPRATLALEKHCLKGNFEQFSFKPDLLKSSDSGSFEMASWSSRLWNLS